ncbi:FAD-dependent oxidoreductase [Stakelama pacifica]|uniref:FAD dependent oxidoreductase n=1 Tax=Stakelama pacifica TaxID=517720 RepID=A0A4R6FKU2_9SPHN|nr:GMC family oxidoreductase [Stakelama pacifica]TDN81204.1 FAD dependent oxidoreductase [Stakelama pacifica]GGO97063.1 GMC oxidoreductase [Stakelama pacifica]
MIFDTQKGSIPADLKADVTIIGAGAAGITMALELADAGLAVILLEAGGRAFSTASQEFYRAHAVEPASHGTVDMFRRRVFGGSTSVWGGRCIPFDPIDFEDRPWMAHGRWPIGYDDVARHYPRALDYAQAGPAAFLAGEALPGEPAPMVPGIESDDVVLDRIERFSNPLHFGDHYRERLRASSRITVLLNAPVVQILTNDNASAARGVRVRGPDGSLAEIASPRVVIAAGGIETARLLLISNEIKSCGLGNERDLVGRFYQCHFEGELGEIRFEKSVDQVRMDYQRSPQGIYCRRYIWLSPEAQRRHQLAGLVLRPNHANIVDPDHRHPVLSAMYLVKSRIVPEYARKLTSLEDQKRLERGGSAAAFWGAHLRNMVLGGPKLAAFTLDFARRRTFAKRKLPSVVLRDPRNLYPLDINAEQEPNPDSRIMLGDSKDAHGVPRISVDWRTTEGDHQRLVKGLRLVADAFNAGDTASVRFSDADYEIAMQRKVPVGGHHIGTARMGETDAIGVCDANCELFGTRGVYIAGAAAFSTSSFANPTLTLIALTLRLAARIAEESRASVR